MLILASKSPRRQELLKKITSDFVVMESHFNEESFPHISPSKLSLELSKGKAYDIFKNHQNDIVIASDTIVIFNNEIYGKPKDEKDAYRMIKNLSGKKHIVLTSYTIISKDIEINKTCRTEVYFNNLDDKVIYEYIKTCKPFDKAGAYGIQDKEFSLIKKIVGSYDNVMGLPTEELRKDLKPLLGK